MSYALFFDPEKKSSRSRTKQSFAKACDINEIMKSWERSGVITHVRNAPGVYEDFSGVEEYDQAMIKIRRAQEAFATLSPSVRRFFNNDPAELIRFVDDPENSPQAESLGLFERPPSEEGPSGPQAEGPSDTPAPEGATS